MAESTVRNTARTGPYGQLAYYAVRMAAAVAVVGGKLAEAESVPTNFGFPISIRFETADNSKHLATPGLQNDTADTQHLCGGGSAVGNTI